MSPLDERIPAPGFLAAGVLPYADELPAGVPFAVAGDELAQAMRLAARDRRHEIFVVPHDPLAAGEDGRWHQPVDRLAMLRAIPGLTVVRPADALETHAAWALASEPASGPWALVLAGRPLPSLGPREAPVERGAYVLAEPAGRTDVVLIASGAEVAVAVEAAALLARRGSGARVVSMPSWELFDAQDQAYRDGVIPPGVPRVSLEAGVTMGWHRFVGERGIALGLDRAGAAAPGAPSERDGLGAERVAAAAETLLGPGRARGRRTGSPSPLFGSRSLLRKRAVKPA